MENRKEINWATVEARLTAALFIGIPCYYGHFILVSHFLIYRTVTPVTTARLLCPIGDLISGLPCTVLETNLY